MGLGTAPIHLLASLSGLESPRIAQKAIHGKQKGGQAPRFCGILSA